MLTLALLALGGALLVGWRALEDTEGSQASADTAIVITPSDIESEELIGPGAEFDPKLALDRKLNQDLMAASAGLGLAGLGALCYPPLGIASAFFTVYAAIPLYKYGYHALFKEHRLRAVAVDAIAAIVMLMQQYYVASGISVVSFLISRKILLKTEDHARQKLVNIFGTQPRRVWILQGDAEIEVPFEQLQPGDTVVVNAGQVIPVDGVIRQGLASIDQHMLTGEAQPVEKGPDEHVLAATVLLTGRIFIEVERAGTATVAAQLGTILQRTADYRDEIDSRGERLADQSVGPILGVAALAGLVRGLDAVLPILSSNYVAGTRISMPLSMLGFLNLATQEGILVKDGRVLELLNSIDTVVFDKTGTLTLDEPHLGEIRTCYGLSADALLTYAAAAEARQSHPIARAILQAATERALPLPVLDNARYQMGYGIHAEIDSCSIRVGSARFIQSEGIPIPEDVRDFQLQAHSQGYSLVYVAIGERLAGVLELRPTVRPEVHQVIATLHARGLTTYIISGDHEAPTKRLAAELGIDHCFAEVLPEDKAALVEKLQKEGHKVCFVGDGINDSIALKKATASISLRGATTIATDTAQSVLMDGTLQRLPQLFALSKEFDANARTGTLIMLIPSAFSIAGVFFLGFGIYAALAIWNVTLAASIINSLLPSWRGAPKRELANPRHLLASKSDSLSGNQASAEL